MTNEELEQEVKRLEEQITNLRIKILESKVVDETGEINPIGEVLNYYDFEQAYLRGLVFKTREEAEQYEKERILLFKIHKWAEKHNGGWKPNWDDEDEKKYCVTYNAYSKKFEIIFYWSYQLISKLPIFKSRELAEQFIEEFGEEIKEVLC